METKAEPQFEIIENRLLQYLDKGRNKLYEHEIYELMDILGFRTPHIEFITDDAGLESLDIARFPGGKVVCKLISDQMIHRFEHGGIEFTERSVDAIRNSLNNFRALAEGAGIELKGMMVAEMIDGTSCIQNELLLSLRQDHSFGPVVYLGLGGVGTEVYKQYLKEGRDLVIRAASRVYDYDSTRRDLENTLFYSIITGNTRIKPDPVISGKKVYEVIERFARLAEWFSPVSESSPVTIEEIEINPIQVTSEGDFVPLDALMRISRNKSRSKPPSQSCIKSLLEPERVLIIGASAKKMNAGRIILKNIIKGGVIPKEKILLLHKDAEEIDGCRAYHSIDDIPGTIDMAVFTIPANEESVGLLENMIREGKSNAITIIPGGFSETEKGKNLELSLERAIEESREKNDKSAVVNGPNCLGIVSRPGGYNTFFLPEYKLPFNGKFGERCAIISQSGAYLVTLISNMSRLLYPKYLVTYGNQIDLTVTDYLIYLKDDPDIDFFCLYLEGFKPYDGERFLKVAKEIIGSGKQIIMYKTGRTRAGAAAVASHTASMAGDYEVLHRILLNEGVIMPDTLNEVEDAIKVFTFLNEKNIRGRRVGILANAGFECSVTADRLYSMELASFSDETLDKLHEALPTDIIDVYNPVDVTPQTNAVNYGKCLAAIDADPGVDCIVAGNVAPTPFMETLPAGEGHNEDIAHENSYPNITIRIFESTDKPMIVSVDSGKLYDPAVEMMEEAGLPCFRKVDRGMKALDVFLRYSGPR